MRVAARTEGTITLAGVALGADYEDAAVAAILLRVAVLPLSCLCGVLYWRESHGGGQPRASAA